jgi:hypothetical protein
MNRTILLCGVAALGAFLPIAALAQDEESDSDIVVTAPLEGSRIESLQGAEVLGREEIVEQLNGGLGDTLDATPGITTTILWRGRQPTDHSRPGRRPCARLAKRYRRHRRLHGEPGSRGDIGWS